MKKILIIHFKNIYREITTLPIFISIVFLCVIVGVLVALCMQSGTYPHNAIILSALLILLLNFHANREDLGFIRLLTKKVSLISILEYTILFLPLFISYIYFGNYVFSAILLLSIYLISIIQIPKKRSPNRVLTRIISIVYGRQIEWIAGFRRYYIGIIPLLLIAGYICFKEPYIALFILLFAVFLTQPFYVENEPIDILHIYEGDPKSFLFKKINGGYINILKMCSPVLLLYLVNQYQMWYFMIYFLAVTYLFMVLVVSAKYSSYTLKQTTMPSILQSFGLIGVIFPPFLPITLCFAIHYYFSAKTNLKEYLYASIE